MAGRVQLLSTSSAASPVHSVMDAFQTPPNVGLSFQRLKLAGRPRPEPWRSWRDLILQRVPAVVTSPNGASPQSKHCNPPIPSHSRISQLVPPEYGVDLGRGKIGTQTGVIFASWCEPGHGTSFAMNVTANGFRAWPSVSH